MRICPISGSSNWKDVYNSTTDQIMTGDQRLCKGSLKKIICTDSGVVANKQPLTNIELENLYGREYELNTLGKEEHFFYTSNGSISRSQVFFDWIDKLLDFKFETLIEIGCGEGNLLQRFSEKYPSKNIIGFDGSKKAVDLAQKKNLKVEQKLILSNDSFIPEADIIILVNVIEHVENISEFIDVLKKSTREKGKIVFTLPIQDFGGYDVFFAEHVWHFTVAHFENVLLQNGLNIVYSDINHPINHGIGLFICELSKKPIPKLNKYKSDIIKNNIDFWLSNFNNLNQLLLNYKSDKISVFGASEIFTLFMVFSELSKYNIISCIDDTKELGSIKHGIPVYKSEWLNKNPIDLLLLAVNKKYHELIKNKLAHLDINIQPIY